MESTKYMLVLLLLLLIYVKISVSMYDDLHISREVAEFKIGNISLIPVPNISQILITNNYMIAVGPNFLQHTKEVLKFNSSENIMCARELTETSIVVAFKTSLKLYEIKKWTLKGHISVNYEIKKMETFPKHIILMTESFIELFKIDKQFEEPSINRVHVEVKDVLPTKIPYYSPDQVFIMLTIENNVELHTYKNGNFEKQFQTKFSSNVKSIKLFNNIGITYLAVLEEHLEIYKFSRFTGFKSVGIKINSVQSILPIAVNTYRSDVILLIQRKEKIETIVMNEFGQFIMKPLYCDDCFNKNFSLDKAISFANQIVISDLGNIYYSLDVQPNIKFISNPVALENEFLRNKRQELQHKLAMQESQLTFYRSKFKKVPPKLSYKLPATVKMAYLTVKNVEFAPNENDTFDYNSVEFAGENNWTELDSQVKIKNLTLDCLRITQRLASFSDEVKTNIFDNSVDDQDLPTFVDTELIMMSGNLKVDNFIVKKLNGVAVDPWLENIYRIDKPVKISGKKHINEIELDNLVFDTINEIPAENLIFQNQLNVSINGNLIIKDDFIVEHELNGLTHGLDFQKDIFRIDQYFPHPVNISSLNIMEQTTINGVFNDVPFLLPTHTISDIDLNSFNEARIDYLKVSDYLDVTHINNKPAKEIFSKLIQRNITECSNNVKVEYINGLKFPEDFVRQSETGQVFVPSSKNFTGSIFVQNLELDLDTLMYNLMSNQQRSRLPLSFLKVDELIVNGSLNTQFINKIDIMHLNEIFLSKNHPQKINLSTTKLKTKHLKVKILNQLNFSNFNNTMLKSIHVKDDIILKRKKNRLTVLNPIFVTNLSIDGLISNKNLTKLNKDFVYPDSKIYIRGRKNFTENLSTKHLNLEQLSKLPLKNYLTLQGDHILSGSLNIQKNVEIQGSLYVEDEQINGINLVDLQQKLTSKNDVLKFYKDIKIKSPIDLDDIEVEGSINGINFNKFMKNVVLLNDDVNFETKATTFFGNVSVNGNLTINGLLNNKNLTDTFDKMIYTDRNGVISGTLKTTNLVGKKLRVIEELFSKTIQDIHLNEWKNQSISLIDANESVLTSMKFQHVQISKDVQTELINGKNVKNLITLKGPQIIPTAAHFSEIFLDTNVEVGQYVNNKNLHEICSKSLMNNGNQIVRGWKTFAGHLKIEKNLWANKINNLSISKLLTTNTDQEITGKFTFVGKTTMKNVMLNGLLNNINISEWKARAALSSEHQELNVSWNIMGNVEVMRNISGPGSINNIHLKDFSTDLVRKIHLTNSVQSDINKRFNYVCNNITNIYNKFANQEFFLEYYEEIKIKNLVFSKEIQKLIPLQAKHFNFLIITFSNRCNSKIYRWNQTHYILGSDLSFGPIENWATLSTSDDFYLITSTPLKNKPCEKNQQHGNIWHITEHTIKHVATFPGFSDILIQSPNFYTIDQIDFSLKGWAIDGGKIVPINLPNIEPGGRFDPKSQLAPKISLVSKKNEYVEINQGNVTTKQIYQLIPLGKFVVSTNFTATSDETSTIIIYENFPFGYIYDMLHFSKPSHLHWIDFGPEEFYLTFATNHQKIQIFQYQGVSGFIKKSTLHYPSDDLTVTNLPNSNQLLLPHILIANGKRVIVLKPKIRGIKSQIRLPMDC